MSEETTITVIKPLKIIALIFEFISLVALIVAIATPTWLDTKGFKQGLWRQCEWEEDNAEECEKVEHKAWIAACGAFCIIAMLCIIAAIILTVVGLCSKSGSTKGLFYKLSFVVIILAVLCMVIALIVFPAMFIKERKEYSSTKWYFQWAYGLAWGATIFMVAAAILICMDRENYEVYEHKYQSDA